ncbi:39S ribosomal protein L20, mitochondrial-like [Asterias rubens]|uniref:39S ribosomal protein L20, mitochondrial-like n=1 Tax=Asterias rubens TaxID=7604 RepID=UPI0014556D24|nr:39S ribosomal protein L20, mitochondrial-like [Asterias rubens]
MVHLSAARLIRSRGTSSYWKRKFVFDQTQHFFGRRRNCYSIAIRALQKAWVKAYSGRRHKKRLLRKLWIGRINSAVKEHDITYSPFMENLLKYNIQLDRKILSILAITEPKTFKCLAELAKAKREEGLLAAVRANPDRVLSRQTTQDDLLESVKKLRISDQQSTQTLR